LTSIILVSLFNEVDVASFLCKEFITCEERVNILYVAVEDTDNGAWEVLQQDLNIASSFGDFVEVMYYPVA
jgi:hypothetical protein